MSQGVSPALDIRELERLLFNLWLVMIPIIRAACHAHGFYPQETDLEDLRQDICVLLIKRNYRRLRSFAYRSTPTTWLFRVTFRHVGRHLRKQGKIASVRLEDVPPDLWAYRPAQEEKLLFEVRLKAVQTAIIRMTKRKQKLFALLCQDGLRLADIAEQMGTKPNTVRKDKHTLIQELRGNIEGGGLVTSGEEL